MNSQWYIQFKFNTSSFHLFHIYILFLWQWEIWHPCSFIYFFDQVPFVFPIPSTTLYYPALITQLGFSLPKPVGPSPSIKALRLSLGGSPLCWAALWVDVLLPTNAPTPHSEPLSSPPPQAGFAAPPQGLRKKRKGNRKNVWTYFMHLNVSVFSFITSGFWVIVQSFYPHPGCKGTAEVYFSFI